MAKNWEVKADENSAIMVRNFSSKVLVDGKDVITTAESLEFDMEVLFPDFLTFDEVQKNSIINGIKQKFDDSIARSKDAKLSEEEKREVMETLLDRIWNDRKWNMESKESGKRGPSVSLKVLVPALKLAGLDTAAIAAATGKTEKQIQDFLDTGNEENSEE